MIHVLETSKKRKKTISFKFRIYGELGIYNIMFMVIYFFNISDMS